MPAVLLRGERSRRTEGRDRPGQRDHLGRSARGDRDIGVRCRARLECGRAQGSVRGPVDVVGHRADRPADAYDQDHHRGDDQQHQHGQHERPLPARSAASSATTTTRTAAAAATATLTPSTSARRRRARCLPPRGPDRRGTSPGSHLTPAQQLCQLPGHGGRRTRTRTRTRGRGLGDGDRRRRAPATSRAVGPSPAWCRTCTAAPVGPTVTVTSNVGSSSERQQRPHDPAQPVQVEHTDRAQRQAARSASKASSTAPHRRQAPDRLASRCDVVPHRPSPVMNSTLSAPCADHYPHPSMTLGGTPYPGSRTRPDQLADTTPLAGNRQPRHP